MSKQVLEIGVPKNVSSSGAVTGVPTDLLGVFCNSSASGTLKIYDGTGTSGAVVCNTFSVFGGQWYPLPFKFATGVYVTVGGTADVTFSWQPSAYAT